MTSTPLRRLLSVLAAASTVALTATACGAGSTGEGSGATTGSVVTSFYPVQFATEQITGGALPVSVLTKPGAEPHDLELSPQDVAGLTQARLVVYADGFQPAVDEAMAEVPPERVLDVADAAQLTLTATEESHEGESTEEHEAHGAAEHGGNDPHV